MKRNPIIEILADPTKFFLINFVIGTLAFTIISDGFSALFWDQVKTLANAQPWMSEFWFTFLFTLGLLSIVFSVIYSINFTQWIGSQLTAFGLLSEPDSTNVAPLKATYPGLIVLMSLNPQDSPAEVAIRHHLKNNRLKYCWVICTRDSCEPARKMIEQLKQQGAESVRFYYGGDPIENVEQRDRSLTLTVPDDKVDDPNYICNLVEGIYADADRYGLTESDVIADYTGGTKGLTVGLLLACAKPARSLQYISQVHHPPIMEVKINYKLKQSKRAKRQR